MHYEGTTYRPPPEADSLLLQVTVGCAHNRCTFCNMYRDVTFRRSSMAEIETDLEEARGIYPRAERVFLVNGDAFVLEAERLAAVAERIKAYFPECRTIAAYAAVRNIRTKSDGELERLAGLGIDDLYVGIESGWDAVLAKVDKGHTVAEARRQLGRLQRAGIGHRASVMLGVAGHGDGLENARRTAAFLNETRPNLVWAGTTAIFADTPLGEAVAKGEFLPATEMEILEEEKALIRAIELENVPFWGNHPTNSVPVCGRLSADRERLVAAIDDAVQRYGEARLDRVIARATM